ncbi:metalloregulator ArsR/SmtB family transcription factor [Enterococcus mundtii]|uniref:ArsR/SmtB family transcription factor n=1 Tax=Enterococcus TaxID=1350 RepID=UPI00044AAFD8|nr:MULTISPECIES: metalloregulator ArsR/SmtB family transcription factor [Enterococcus]AZP93235.1 ArsR family transcriptional regulator [Enterococcus mundtii]EYT96619.1 ArsR family transcriptional regulator [Enterococcus mundtii CRL35]MDA9430096.1 transcriptional regulator (ArsR family) [Enterococcus mundtii 1A]MDK4210509.1 metalloregulator ArsR/SmtB family transcription factor [Enterococcus mundtii]MDO7879064.1 metalloregulator ArsR/SmtB family transcription factor [Enterococcus mundtii]
MSGNQNIQVEKVSQLFKVLSDPTRLNILLYLKDGEKNVTSISQSVQMEQSAVSHQLRLLRENHVVKSRREGKTILYSLDDFHVLDILEQTIKHVEHQKN